MADVTQGLERVAVAESRICSIDGEVGELIYQGYDIQDLAANTTFEEVAYLLWRGDLPSSAELSRLNDQFVAERDVDDAVYDLVRALPKHTVTMDALRTLVSLLASYDDEMADNSPDANMRKSVRLTAKIPTLLAAAHRAQKGLEPIRPKPTGGIASNFLYMLSGSEPDEFVAKTLDTALILHAEHGMNASTFSGRVTCATLADLYAGVTSAIGTLKGPLHGGANALVLEMLGEIGEPEKAGDYVARVLDGSHTVGSLAPKRIPGLGHRVYKALDPRATVLRGMSRTLGERAGDLQWIDLSEAVVEACEAAGLSQKSVYPNVDFFSASTYQTMGIDTSLFTPVFAMARITGWTAHIMEQHAQNRLIRPHAVYVGERGRVTTPISER
ncbi:citrate synthase [Candidatus Poribacteria bacterium]|nr:citrate synthase [Candidatus Poribacteria bacterium]